MDGRQLDDIYGEMIIEIPQKVMDIAKEDSYDKQGMLEILEWFATSEADKEIAYNNNDAFIEIHWDITIEGNKARLEPVSWYLP